jgi:hypothetical protein
VTHFIIVILSLVALFAVGDKNQGPYSQHLLDSQLSGALLKGGLLPFSTNIKLGRKDPPGINTLAYWVFFSKRKLFNRLPCWGAGGARGGRSML